MFQLGGTSFYFEERVERFSVRGVRQIHDCFSFTEALNRTEFVARNARERKKGK